MLYMTRAEHHGGIPMFVCDQFVVYAAWRSMQLTDCAMQMKMRMGSMAAGAGLGRQRWTARMRQPWMNCSTRPAGSLAAGESSTMLAMDCTGVVRLQYHGSQVVANAGMWSGSLIQQRLLSAAEPPSTAGQRRPVA